MCFPSSCCTRYVIGRITADSGVAGGASTDTLATATVPLDVAAHGGTVDLHGGVLEVAGEHEACLYIRGA